MGSCIVCAGRLARSHTYCPRCGARAVSESDSSVERKQISVLFADLCGSTACLSALDPEEARACLDTALRPMCDAVEAYGGTISQLLGDGLLALFGAPLAQEDHALRACLAAISMQHFARERAALGSDPRLSMVLRVGIHSGEAIVGMAKAQQAAHYWASGATIHLASRLEQLARPGTVLVSGATFRLAQGHVDATTIGAREIRGFDLPVALYELEIDGARSAAAPLARRRQWAPLVGRSAALAALGGIAERARARQMQVVGLRGEAGIGKSRLIVELCASVHAAGFVVCMVYSRSYASRGAYNLIADLMRELIGLSTGLDPSASRRVAAERLDCWPPSAAQHRAAAMDLLDLAAPSAEWLALSPALRRRRICDALRWLIAQRLQAGPLLLVLEDIFLADRESQRLLELLVPGLETLPVFVCVSYRHDFQHRWADARWFTEQWVAPLQEGDMSSLAGSLLGQHESLAALVVDLIERADGNPFFLEQLVVTLIDDGSLVGPPGAYRLTRPQAELRVPASIAAVIGARVDRLPAAAKASLEAAAILGQRLHGKWIGAMQGIELSEAESHLRLALASGLLSAPSSEAAATGYSFRHALVQEVIDAALTRPRRKALHRSAFFALRDGLGDQALDWAHELTHHAFRGEEWAQAAAYAAQSTARAVARTANREALRLFELGLDAAVRVSDASQRSELELGLRLEALGALMSLGQLDALISNLERADVIARELGDVRRQAAVSMQLAVSCWMHGRFTQGLVHAGHARDAGLAAGRRTLEMSAVQSEMMMYHGMGQYRQAVQRAEYVLAKFEPELRSRRMLTGWATEPAVNLYAFLSSALWRLDEQLAARHVFSKAYAELAESDHAYSHALIDFVQGQMWIENAEADRAAVLLRATVRSCEVNDVPTMLPCAMGMLGGALARSGQAQEAVALLHKALDDRIYLAGGSYGQLFIRHNLGIALTRLGQFDEAVAASRFAVEFATTGEQFGHRAEALYGLGEALQGAGRSTEAVLVYSQALAQAQACEMAVFTRFGVARLAELHSVAGVLP